MGTVGYQGQWHGKKFYFGLHYDLHAGPRDKDLGTRCAPADLIPAFKLMRPDFVQTDCKGHAGYTSWFSQVPEASISPGVVKDALQQWRAGTRKLGLPLHCHYSGIWDMAAGAKHPEWCVVSSGSQSAVAPTGQNTGAPTHGKMCPRSPYLEKLMIPQMLELIDRYQVDGFWIDGDLWAVEPCYCALCKAAFREATGLAEPPVMETDPNWPRWWNFLRESFEAYVTRYCDAVHAHKPGVLVCSNWLQTFRHPGAPTVPTDWISGDNSFVWGLDESRCEARFLSTRGKPWDIMIWSFCCSHGDGHPEAPSPWMIKPVSMLQQESAMLVAFGGQVQIYERPRTMRTGQFVPWRMQRLNAVGRFVKARRALCQDTESIPQIAVLHSEHHVRATGKGKNPMWGADVSSVRGAIYALLENHYGVDVADEWALLPRLAEFPVVIAPEQDGMSEGMVSALKEYVRSGGRLLISGAKSFDRFGSDFLGARSKEIKEKVIYEVPAADGTVPLYSDQWRLLEPVTASAHGRLGLTPLPDEQLLPHPALTINRMGDGWVGYIPADVFRDFNCNRYPLTRAFIGAAVRKLAGPQKIKVTGPTCVDVVLRKKGGKRIVHLINRASGLPNSPNNGMIDEIPPVGPVSIEMELEAKPARVKLAFEKQPMTWKFRPGRRGGKLRIQVPLVQIHSAVVVE